MRNPLTQIAMPDERRLRSLPVRTSRSSPGASTEPAPSRLVESRALTRTTPAGSIPVTSPSTTTCRPGQDLMRAALPDMPATGGNSSGSSHRADRTMPQTSIGSNGGSGAVEAPGADTRTRATRPASHAPRRHFPVRYAGWPVIGQAAASRSPRRAGAGQRKGRLRSAGRSPISRRRPCRGSPPPARRNRRTGCRGRHRPSRWNRA